MKYLSMILLMTFAMSIQAQNTEFTFQGKLNESGSPVFSPRDLRFRLWNAESAGAQVGVDVTMANVTFVGGVFSVRIDFGGAAFNGEPRWIEIAVSPPGAGTYVTLTPRQRLGSSPYAIKSLNSVQADSADIANTAQNSNALGGTPAAEFVLTADSRLSDARDPLPGSASYVQNQNAAPQASTNFNISGTGVANILRAETQFNLGTSRVFHSPSSNLFVGRSTGTNFTTGAANTVVGGTAGNGMINASGNSIFGTAAGFDNQGSDNSFFGRSSGQQNQSGNGNSFFGWQAGISNLNGNSNSYFGIGTGGSNTSGSNNTLLGAAATTGADGLSFATALGAGATVSTNDTLVLGRSADTVRVPGSLFSSNVLSAGTQFNIGNGSALSFGTSIENLHVGGGSPNSSGTGLTFVGRFSGFANTSGGGNSFFGTNSGRLNTTGGNNSYFGYNAGFNGSGGNNNAFFGQSSGAANLTGSSNSFFGSSAGQNNTSGSNNTLVGAGANTAFNDMTFATAIGSGATVFDNNSIVLGRGADTVRVPGLTSINSMTANQISTPSLGVGTSTPASPLDVHGQARTSGPQAGFFFEDRGSGPAGWLLYGSGFYARLNIGGTDKLAVSVGGILSVTNLASGTSTHACWNTGTGEFAFCSSSARYKTDISDFRSGLDLVKQLRPVSFTWKGDGKRDVGFIAEEVEAIEPLFTFRNKKGEIEGVNYGQLSTVFVNAINQQQTEIESQRVTIERLSSELSEIKGLLCKLLPNAVQCGSPVDQKGEQK